MVHSSSNPSSQRRHPVATCAPEMRAPCFVIQLTKTSDRGVSSIGSVSELDHQEIRSFGLHPTSMGDYLSTARHTTAEGPQCRTTPAGADGAASEPRGRPRLDGRPEALRAYLRAATQIVGAGRAKPRHRLTVAGSGSSRVRI
jgi:hypothetical protein